MAEEYVEFVETGYEIGEEYTTYGGFIKNKKSDKAITNFTLEIELLDENGNVLETSIQNINFLMQDQTRAFGGDVYYSSKDPKVASVNFKAVGGTSAKAFKDEYLVPEDFEVKDLKQGNQGNSSIIIGTAVNKTDKQSQLLDVVLLTRKDGKIVAGARTMLRNIAPKGEYTFQTTLFHNSPLEGVEVLLYDDITKSGEYGF